MFTIKNKNDLNPVITLMDIEAPLVAANAKPGQFVVVIIDEKGERIPLTIAGIDKRQGSVRIIFQQVGFTTQKLAGLNIGDKLFGFLGPLGNPTDLEKIGTVICIGGGVGIAEILPIVKGFKEASNRVLTIIGSRTQDLLILEDELKIASDELFITTDDGSKGKKGFVSDVLISLIEERALDAGNCLVFAVGPVKMMQRIAGITREKRIKTIVSLNPIMVDATGMCGACRVSVGGQTRFACVDGPEFDAHQVDFAQLESRLAQYKTSEHECRMKTQLKGD